MTNKKKSFLTDFLNVYIQLIEAIALSMSGTLISTNILKSAKILLNNDEEKSIDERIKRIDQARENLIEGLNAMDELRASAEESMKSVKETREELARLQTERQSAESELAHVKKIVEVDAETLRRVVGIPSQTDKRRDRIIGFVSGVLASIVASLILWGLVKLWPWMISLLKTA